MEEFNINAIKTEKDFENLFYFKKAEAYNMIIEDGLRLINKNNEILEKIKKINSEYNIEKVEDLIESLEYFNNKGQLQKKEVIIHILEYVNENSEILPKETIDLVFKLIENNTELFIYEHGLFFRDKTIKDFQLIKKIYNEYKENINKKQFSIINWKYALASGCVVLIIGNVIFVFIILTNKKIAGEYIKK